MGKKSEMSDEDMDALMEAAELEAAADTTADELVEREIMKEQGATAEEGAGESDDNPYLVKFRQEYEWDKERVTELDLSGLANLTTVDLEYADRVLANMRHSPRNKYQDTSYQKHIAMRVTGYPSDFFNMLQVKDMLSIGGAVYTYFLLG